MNPPSPAEYDAWQSELRAAERAADEQRKAIASTAVITTPGQPGYRGEFSCGDCCSMSHCETHGKEPGTYPFEPEAAAAVLPHPFHMPERG